MDNNDPLKDLTEHLEMVKYYDKIEETLKNTKSEIKEDSDDYKFFYCALNACMNMINTLITKVRVTEESKEFIIEIGKLVGLMMAHVQGVDKTDYKLIRNYDEVEEEYKEPSEKEHEKAAEEAKESLNIKTAIKKDSKEYKLFSRILGTIIFCYSEIFNSVQRKLKKKEFDYFQNIGQLVNILCDHIQGNDMSQYNITSISDI